MKRLCLVWGVLLCGCDMTVSDLTQLDRLQVVATVVDPPEVQPGEDAVITAHISSPELAAFDTLLWSCTRTGESCLEGQARLPFDQYTSIVRGETSTASWTLTVDPATSLVLEEIDSVSVEVWVLACEPGVCDLFDTVANPPDPTTDAGAELAADLANPMRWLADAPSLGVSVARQVSILSNRSDPERNVAPTIAATFQEPLLVGVGGELDLDFDVVGGPKVYPYATLGGFEFPVYDASSGVAAVRFVAPDEAGTATIYVVAEDGLGGSAVFQGTVVVEAE